MSSLFPLSRARALTSHLPLHLPALQFLPSSIHPVISQPIRLSIHPPIHSSSQPLHSSILPPNCPPVPYTTTPS